MLSFHDFVHQSKGKNDENKISKFVKKLKSKAKLIYFDEFQVTNIVDAMILGKLFKKIFDELAGWRCARRPLRGSSLSSTSAARAWSATRTSIRRWALSGASSRR